MAITFVQTAQNSGSGGVDHVAIAYNSNNAAGNLLIAVVLMRSASSSITVSAADTAGNTWATAVDFYDSSNGERVTILYAQNSLAGANTVTATISTSFVTNMQLGVLEYSGAKTTSVLDGVSASAGQLASSDVLIDPGSLTTTAAGSLLLTLAYSDTSFHTTPTAPPLTAGSGFTERFDFTSITNQNMSVQDQVAGAAGSKAMAFATSGWAWAVAGASFKSVAVVSDPPFFMRSTATLLAR